MKVAVVYKSKTGFTKKYAEYIAGILKGELLPFENRQEADPQNFDTLIFGGPVIAASVSGLGWFLKNRSRFPRTFAFACGASPADSPDLHPFLEGHKKKGVDLFYMPGGLAWEKMNKVTHFVMRNIFLPSVKKEHGGDSGIYRTLSSSYDLSDFQYADHLIRAVRRV